jgi:hypothetical protein
MILIVVKFAGGRTRRAHLAVVSLTFQLSGLRNAPRERPAGSRSLRRLTAGDARDAVDLAPYQ